MSQFSFKDYYRRRLPHIQPAGATLFITFRLANSLPQEVIERLIAERKQILMRVNVLENKTEREQQQYLIERSYFGKWDEALDNSQTGENYLKDARVAQMVLESIRYREQKEMDIDAFCIMSNHVHIVFRPLQDSDGQYYSLAKIMHSLKRYTAYEANQILNRTGQFWQHENYDHVVRNEAEHERIIKYVLNNPVKVGLVGEWQKWKWSYSKYKM